MLATERTNCKRHLSGAQNKPTRRTVGAFVCFVRTCGDGKGKLCAMDLQGALTPSAEPQPLLRNCELFKSSRIVIVNSLICIFIWDGCVFRGPGSTIAPANFYYARTQGADNHIQEFTDNKTENRDAVVATVPKLKKLIVNYCCH